MAGRRDPSPRGIQVDARHQSRTLPNEAEAEYRTAGGFVVTQFGRIPAVGDRFEWSGWRFEVAEMDRRRVDKVIVAGSPGAPPQAPA
jgi:putative hemolysin